MVRITDGDGDDACIPWSDWTGSIEDYEAGLDSMHPNCTRDAEAYFADDPWKAAPAPSSLERTLTELVTRAAQPVAPTRTA